MQYYHNNIMISPFNSHYHHPITILSYSWFGRFQSMGVPGTLNHPFIDGLVPWNKPSSDQGVPQFMETPYHHHHHPDMTIIFYHQFTLWLLFPVYHHPITILSPCRGPRRLRRLRPAPQWHPAGRGRAAFRPQPGWGGKLGGLGEIWG